MGAPQVATSIPRVSRERLRRAMRSTRRASHGALSVRRGKGAPGVAYSVGKDVGTAVTRNRLRRRLRAVVQRRVGAGRIDSTYLVIARSGAEQMSFESLGDAVCACMADLCGGAG